MKTYEVRFESRYDYTSAAQSGYHVARLLPAQRIDQSVLSSALTVSPSPRRAGSQRDFFANPVNWFTLEDPHEAFLLAMVAQVAVNRQPTLLGHAATCREIATRARHVADLGCDAPAHYLAPTAATAASPAIVALAQEMFAPDAPLAAAALACARAIQQRYTYKPGTTEVWTTAAQAERLGAGVCQDFAHIMIAACRALGLPARYVSGYIRTLPPPGQPRLEGADAMHAWVSLWLGADTGWLDFDPTNGCAVLDDHIVVATGRDYQDTAPVRGEMVGSGEQRHTVAVDVRELG